MADDLRSHVREVHRFADEARAITMAAFRRPLRVDLKPDGSPVTGADREVESFLRARLRERFPGGGIRVVGMRGAG